MTREKNGVVVVFGVGFHEVPNPETTRGPARLFGYNGRSFKGNQAAGAVRVLLESGHRVVPVVEAAFVGDILSVSCGLDRAAIVELPGLEQSGMSSLADSLIEQVTGCELSVVFYGGVSGKRTNDVVPTITGDVFSLTAKAIGPLCDATVGKTVRVLQGLRAAMLAASRTKFIVISATIAKRPQRWLALDSAYNGALHGLARSLAIDLTREKIFVTEILPGMTDAGFYDSESHREFVMRSAKEFGYDYSRSGLPLFDCDRIGEAVKFAIEFDGAVRELTLIPYGQYPHLEA